MKTSHSAIIFSLFCALFSQIAQSAYGSSDDRYVGKPMPEGWTTDTTGYFALSMCDDVNWWKKFGDSALDSLISIGTANNYNLAVASRRIMSAKAAMGQAIAGYYPQLGLEFGWSRTRTSGELGNNLTPAVNSSVWNGQINMNWEVDVFGRIRSKVKAADASVDVSRADYAAAMVSLQAEIASQYLQLRTWQEQRTVAMEHARNQHKLVVVAEARYEAELASLLDVSQAKTVYYSTLATLPSLDNLIESGKNSLAVLCGLYPGQISSIVETDSVIPDCNEIVAVDLPLSLLERRADIVALRKQIDMDAYNLGYARKEYLPTLSISGSVGTEAGKAKNLFKSKSYTYTIAPVLNWTIFDGFSRRNSIKRAQETLKADIDNYNQGVLTAVQEVDNAMVSIINLERERNSLADVVEHARKAENLSFELFRGGLTPIINVVNAQLSYLQYENSMVVNRGKAMLALVNLYKALGGGWSASVDPK